MGNSRLVMVRKLLKEYDGQTLSLRELRVLLAELASQEKAITEYLRLLNGFGIINEIKHLQFKISL